MVLNSKFVQMLKENPYLVPSRMELEYLSSISIEAIDERYNYIGEIEGRFIKVYENIGNGLITAGMIYGDRFYIILSLTCEERSLYIKSMQLSPNRKHIKMVMVSKEAAENAVARDVYVFIASHFDLISDRVQYLGAKSLWKSLAKESSINIYVFDEKKKSYLKDDKGDIIKYNGYNINDVEIWGDSETHQHRLLVATSRTLS